MSHSGAVCVTGVECFKVLLKFQINRVVCKSRSIRILSYKMNVILEAETPPSLLLWT